MHVRGRTVAIGLVLAFVVAGYGIFNSSSGCGSTSSSSASSSGAVDSVGNHRSGQIGANPR